MESRDAPVASESAAEGGASGSGQNDNADTRVLPSPSSVYDMETKELLLLSQELQSSPLTRGPLQEQRRLLLNLALLELRDRRHSDSILNAIDKLTVPHAEGAAKAPFGAHVPQTPHTVGSNMLGDTTSGDNKTITSKGLSVAAAAPAAASWDSAGRPSNSPSTSAAALVGPPDAPQLSSGQQLLRPLPGERQKQQQQLRQQGLCRSCAGERKRKNSFCPSLSPKSSRSRTTATARCQGGSGVTGFFAPPACAPPPPGLTFLEKKQVLRIIDVWLLVVCTATTFEDTPRRMEPSAWGSSQEASPNSASPVSLPVPPPLIKRPPNNGCNRIALSSRKGVIPTAAADTASMKRMAPRRVHPFLARGTSHDKQPPPPKKASSKTHSDGGEAPRRPSRLPSVRQQQQQLQRQQPDSQTFPRHNLPTTSLQPQEYPQHQHHDRQRDQRSCASKSPPHQPCLQSNRSPSISGASTAAKTINYSQEIGAAAIAEPAEGSVATTGIAAPRYRPKSSRSSHASIRSCAKLLISSVEEAVRGLDFELPVLAGASQAENTATAQAVVAPFATHVAIAAATRKPSFRGAGIARPDATGDRAPLRQCPPGKSRMLEKRNSSVLRKNAQTVAEGAGDEASPAVVAESMGEGESHSLERVYELLESLTPQSLATLSGELGDKVSTPRDNAASSKSGAGLMRQMQHQQQARQARLQEGSGEPPEEDSCISISKPFEDPLLPSNIPNSEASAPVGPSGRGLSEKCTFTQPSGEPGTAETMSAVAPAPSPGVGSATVPRQGNCRSRKDALKRHKWKRPSTANEPRRGLPHSLCPPERGSQATSPALASTVEGCASAAIKSSLPSTGKRAVSSPAGRASASTPTPAVAEEDAAPLEPEIAETAAAERKTAEPAKAAAEEDKVVSETAAPTALSHAGPLLEVSSGSQLEACEIVTSAYTDHSEARKNVCVQQTMGCSFGKEPLEDLYRWSSITLPRTGRPRKGPLETSKSLSSTSNRSCSSSAESVADNADDFTRWSSTRGAAASQRTSESLHKFEGDLRTSTPLSRSLLMLNGGQQEQEQAHEKTPQAVLRSDGSDFTVVDFSISFPSPLFFVGMHIHPKSFQLLRSLLLALKVAEKEERGRDVVLWHRGSRSIGIPSSQSSSNKRTFGVVGCSKEEEAIVSEALLSTGLWRQVSSPATLATANLIWMSPRVAAASLLSEGSSLSSCAESSESPKKSTNAERCRRRTSERSSQSSSGAADCPSEPPQGSLSDLSSRSFQGPPWGPPGSLGFRLQRISWMPNIGDMASGKLAARGLPGGLSEGSRGDTSALASHACTSAAGTTAAQTAAAAATNGDATSATASTAAAAEEAAAAALPPKDTIEGQSQLFREGHAPTQQQQRSTVGGAAACTPPQSLSFSQLRDALAAEAQALPEADGWEASRARSRSWEQLWSASCESILKILFCLNLQQQHQQQGFLLLRFSLLPDANGKVWVTKVTPFCLPGGPQGFSQEGPLLGGPPGEEDFRGLVELVRDVVQLVDPPAFDRQKLMKVSWDVKSRYNAISS
ncbi:uncharacterized protein LOC34621274 [Cyclospora cayetanensis]|uniref:Uncharacterized protein LOC34621274 n=1 Tax=Cyclospora cayetanensis TaxID=88456 RepID=A0A6P6RT23_9EIME|nr:uncharacterized protein LOC34621274 [Cyclospora cayetanensis]